MKKEIEEETLRREAAAEERKKRRAESSVTSKENWTKATSKEELQDLKSDQMARTVFLTGICTISPLDMKRGVKKGLIHPNSGTDSSYAFIKGKLNGIMGSFGPIESLKLVCDSSHRPTGSAFVRYYSASSAHSAIQESLSNVGRGVKWCVQRDIWDDGEFGKHMSAWVKRERRKGNDVVADKGQPAESLTAKAQREEIERNIKDAIKEESKDKKPNPKDHKRADAEEETSEEEEEVEKDEEKDIEVSKRSSGPSTLGEYLAQHSKVQINGKPFLILPALTREEEAARRKNEKRMMATMATESHDPYSVLYRELLGFIDPNDRRNLCLSRRGVLVPPSVNISKSKMSEGDVRLRIDSWKRKKSKLQSPNHFVSPVSLSIMNIPHEMDEKQLKTVCIAAANKGRVSVYMYSGEGNEDLLSKVPKDHRGMRKSVKIIKCKITKSIKNGKLLRYGFITFSRYVDACSCLRWMNNNDKGFMAVDELDSSQDKQHSNKKKGKKGKKGKDHSVEEKDEKALPRPIVEFSVESIASLRKHAHICEDVRRKQQLKEKEKEKTQKQSKQSKKKEEKQGVGKSKKDDSQQSEQKEKKESPIFLEKKKGEKKKKREKNVVRKEEEDEEDSEVEGKREEEQFKKVKEREEMAFDKALAGSVETIVSQEKKGRKRSKGAHTQGKRRISEQDTLKKQELKRMSSIIDSIEQRIVAPSGEMSANKKRGKKEKRKSHK
eukprot:gnl/Carplike_NY0171/238_a343_1628.p1 GENE.gnl/Carplike_NY0171/238_a343_1628~~gnl/Carplike_NY0171/238_a343_1628.p1  ORF type:complete len:839 (+),score=325.16 gnl/Carplike_NY0171/238_a343_1628:352-2517(+)